MAIEYTEDQLNNFDKTTIVQLFLAQQSQLKDIDNKLQLVLEQVAVLNSRRFGKSSEKLDIDNQIAFLEVDGEIVFFNEAEAIASITEYDQDEPAKVRPKKVKGKRAQNVKDLPVVPVPHMMSDEELSIEFGENGWYQLPDEIYNRYKFTPAKVELEEHHVGVYKSKKDNHFKKANHPGYLLRNSLVSESLEAAIINAKYVNAVPLYRQEQEFERYGLHITRGEMAHWTILCAERYLSILYDYLHEKIYDYHVLQADETPVRVTKENRTAGDTHYMWVYRTGILNQDKHIILYEYQPSRNATHPRKFLKDFAGICVTDGYQVYHTIEKEREDLKIAGCWAHARRRFDEAVKALPKSSQKNALAYLALKQIQAIYREENKLSDMTLEERLKHRLLTVKPLVDAYFMWVKQNLTKVPTKSKTYNGFSYSINQEKYLRTFLEDGDVPVDNNSAEQSIRGFCIGKKNWVMIDTIAGADSSAIIYSIAETAKANKLKPYDYFEYLLTEIPKHLDECDRSFCEDLLPWSEKLPANCKKEL
ncbi:MAG: IS66 family transposase [Christensenellaceae bacterium]